jgi:hypothetical protein
VGAWGVGTVENDDAAAAPEGYLEAPTCSMVVGAGFGFSTGAVHGAVYPRERWKSARLGVSLPVPR